VRLLVSIVGGAVTDFIDETGFLFYGPAKQAMERYNM
jgi:hypothetical protein